jgi:hypothetical protein
MNRTRITSWLLTMVVAVGLSLGQTAWAHGGGNGDPADSSGLNLGCSLHSLRGAYAIQGSGSFVPPGSPLPFTIGAATPVNFQNLTIFDGQGNLTTPRGVDIIGGLIEENAPTVGTYTVNPDCTGELVLQTDHAPQFGGPHVHHIFITIVGKKLYFTFTDMGATGSGIGERIRD